MSFVRKYMATFLVAVLGMGAFVGAWHLYEDHQNWHKLLSILAAQARQERK